MSSGNKTRLMGNSPEKMSDNKGYLENYATNSTGINVPQMLVAAVENATISGGNVKQSLYVAGAVGISNLVPSYTGSGMWGSASEKYIVEPIIAGALYTLVSELTKGGEAKGSMIKTFGKGFIIGASSAGVAGSLMSTTMSKSRVPSQYSSVSGLRSAANAPVEVTGKAAPFIIS